MEVYTDGILFTDIFHLKTRGPVFVYRFSFEYSSTHYEVIESSWRVKGFLSANTGLFAWRLKFFLVNQFRVLNEQRI
jgi:hypothetical protein